MEILRATPQKQPRFNEMNNLQDVEGCLMSSCTGNTAKIRVWDTGGEIRPFRAAPRCKISTMQVPAQRCLGVAEAH